MGSGQLRMYCFFFFNANLNLNQFRQAMLDGVLPLPQHLNPTMLHVGSNLVR